MSADYTEVAACNARCAIANHKFPNEYSDAIFIQIDQHLKMLFFIYLIIFIYYQ